MYVHESDCNFLKVVLVSAGRYQHLQKSGKTNKKKPQKIAWNTVKKQKTTVKYREKPKKKNREKPKKKPRKPKKKNKNTEKKNQKYREKPRKKNQKYQKKLKKNQENTAISLTEYRYISHFHNPGFQAMVALSLVFL